MSKNRLTPTDIMYSDENPVLFSNKLNKIFANLEAGLDSDGANVLSQLEARIIELEQKVANPTIPVYNSSPKN